MTMLKSKQFQKGLTVRQRGEYVEKVSSKSADVGLLSVHPQVEVTEINLNCDMRLTLTPAGTAVETFYVIAGRIGCMLSSGLQILEPGDYIVTETLEEPTFLVAITTAKLLYVTSKPQFHSFSENLNELRQLAVEVESKDGYTAEHCERIHALSFATGQALALDSNSLFLLEFAAYLHDVGKISIPLTVLNKPSKLSSEEWTIVKKHPTVGRELLDKTFMKEAGRIVEQHHERLDGSGYPYGFSNNEVMVEAAIIAVVDTYDAMTTNRPYRKALSQEEAFNEIRKYSGIHYSKEVVQAFFAAVKKLGIV